MLEKRLHDLSMKHTPWICLIAILAAKSLDAQPVYTPYTFSNIAGMPGGPGVADGTGSDARFTRPDGVAVDDTGAVFVADYYAFMIRKVTAAGVVTTFAGSPMHPGTNDGPGIAARFGGPGPSGVAVDAARNVYVSDLSNHTIRKITPDGFVTTLAGQTGQAGFKDGPNGLALLSSPRGMAVDSDGNVYVADGFAVRKVTKAGEVSTIAGSMILAGSTDGPGALARFGNSGFLINPGPQGLAIDSSGTLFVADAGNATVRMVSQVGNDWLVSTIAGKAGFTGFTDGAGDAARFANGGPYGIACDKAGNLFVTDPAALTIRKITRTATGWTVTTVAGGGPLGGPGTADGMGSDARFSYTKGIAASPAGDVFVADFQNSTIRKITPGGVVTTFVGRAPQGGTNDGFGSTARFYIPRRLAVDHFDNLYVADTQNHAIRSVTPEGVVTTLAGIPGKKGSADGPSGTALFNQPNQMGLDGFGNIYVADFGNSTIREIILTTSSGS